MLNASCINWCQKESVRHLLLFFLLQVNFFQTCFKFGFEVIQREAVWMEPDNITEKSAFRPCFWKTFLGIFWSRTSHWPVDFLSNQQYRSTEEYTLSYAQLMVLLCCKFDLGWRIAASGWTTAHTRQTGSLYIVLWTYTGSDIYLFLGQRCGCKLPKAWKVGFGERRDSSVKGRRPSR